MKAGSVGTSIGVVRCMMQISFGTLADVARGRVSRERSDERLAWWGEETERITGARIDVRGKERLDTDERFIVMSNHQSHFDIPILFRAVSPSLRMVTKKELFRVPVWGRAMKAAGFIEIDRKDRERAKESLDEARRKMRDLGVHVWIAPEGTRSRTGELGPFKKGGFILATEAGLRILPIGLWGTRDILPPDTLAARKGAHVAVVVGEPISPEGLDKDALLTLTRERLGALVDEAKRLAGGARG